MIRGFGGSKKEKEESELAPLKYTPIGNDGGESSRQNGGRERSTEDMELDIDESLMNTGEAGLSTTEATARLREFGPNELEEKVVPKWKKFVAQFTGPMPCMIWTAIFIEGLIDDWPNVFVLLLLQIVNGTVGFYEDSKAGDAVAALKASLKPQAQVKRDGVWKNINAAHLVPGDRVALNAGAGVPADCRVCPGVPIEIDQAALTGESLPVTFSEGDVAKMGSTVTRGEIDAIVAATGANTFFGKTASMIQSVDEMGHFQKILLRITTFLLGISLFLVSICMIYMVANHEPFLRALAFGVVLLVASIPIAMQVVCTTTMALGSRKLAEQKAIVARLSAIEELAGMNMLCSDKTGTLTLNKMVLQDYFTYIPGYTKEHILRYAALAAKWKEPAKDALDTLVLNAVDKAPLDAYEQLEYVPFDPVKKRTEATLRDPQGRVFTVTKGAPNILLALCDGNRAQIEEEFNRTIDELAERGIRALAVAVAYQGEPMKMQGFLTFLDPPRPDTKVTIERAIEHGCDVKMITGDHATIAKETCRVLGMGTQILKADVLPMVDTKETLPKTIGADYGEMIENVNGFAQVFPEHKFLIVEALRQRGWSCGMTGDGVNDAPALKRADIGIAVQGATDAARAASDIILTAPGLSVIVDAIVISRCIFQRMKNYVVYRVACTIQLLCFFFLTILATHPKDAPYNWTTSMPGGEFVENYFVLPVISLVIITILNDGTIISIAYDYVEPSPIPERWNLPIVFTVATCLGLVAVMSSIWLLHMGLDAHNEGSTLKAWGIGDMTYGQVTTMIYLKVSLSDFLTVFSARVANGFATDRKPGTALLSAAVFATILSTILSTNWPFGPETKMESLTSKQATFVWAYCLLWFAIQDLSKVGIYKLLLSFDIAGLRTELELKQKRAEEMRGTTGPEGRIATLEEELKQVKVERLEPLERDVRALRERADAEESGTARLMPSGSSNSMI